MNNITYNYKGCLPSPLDYRDYKVKPAASISSASIPVAYMIRNMPKVKNQKAIFSCVAHAISTIMEYFDSLDGNYRTLSTNFIYGIQKSYCGYGGPGMYLRDACKIGTDLGNPTEDLCPGNNESPKSWELAEAAKANEETMEVASYFKFDSYARCRDEKSIKLALMNYGPILCSIKWYDNFKIDKEGELYGDASGDGGYHALVIYGWNSTGWLIQNSWGSNWGVNGRFVLPYKYKIAEAWSFIDSANDIDSNKDLEVVKPKQSNFMDLLFKILNIIRTFFSKFKKIK